MVTAGLLITSGGGYLGLKLAEFAGGRGSVVAEVAAVVVRLPGASAASPVQWEPADLTGRQRTASGLNGRLCAHSLVSPASARSAPRNSATCSASHR